MDPKDDFAERAYQEQIDRERDQALRDLFRDLNLQGEISSLHSLQGDRDPTRRRISTLLVKAQGTLYLASQRGAAFSDVCDLANEVLRLDPLNARALTLRAIAHAKLALFHHAIEDAERAIDLDPVAGSEFGVPMRDLLQVCRDAATKEPEV